MRIATWESPATNEIDGDCPGLIVACDKLAMDRIQFIDKDHKFQLVWYSITANNYQKPAIHYHKVKSSGQSYYITMHVCLC